MSIFLGLSDGVIELLDLLGIPVDMVEGGVATLLSVAVLYLLKMQWENRKQDTQQLNLQQQTVKLASDANARSDKAFEVSEKSITLSEEAIKVNKELGGYIAQQTKVLEGFNQRLDNIEVKVDTMPKLLNDFRTGLIKHSVTRVVVRDPNKNVISMFVARPETLPNGDQVLVVDLGKIKRKVEKLS